MDDSEVDKTDVQVLGYRKREDEPHELSAESGGNNVDLLDHDLTDERKANEKDQGPAEESKVNEKDQDSTEESKANEKEAVYQKVAQNKEGKKKPLISIFFGLVGHFLNWLNQYSNLMVALATFALAFLTYSHIDEAREMRKETKKLADSSIKQFMIKSYPVFLVVTEKTEYIDGIFNHSYQIHNMGELAAHDVTCLFVQVFKDRKKRWMFIVDSSGMYEGKNRSSNLDYSEKIPPNSHKKISFKKHFEGEYAFEEMVYQLVYIRFKVPYDDIVDSRNQRKTIFGLN
ncbi:hypothetical protein DSCA_60670 [Desulfosarcina alkanivorans]|uniref:Uncharacterized protein n=1 Tax=Desulfosarcina alkanivorans TaxID=571177 RepID=A0A5K7Z6D3_9BACT|nr:hypothetical protein [Desulfosarcina alkanivorans]BBO72137.1 hypothetical protein DSCA_60670 [Desulfosarcina alkanivorans]